MKRTVVPIIDLLIKETNKQLVEQDLVVEIDHAVKEWLVKNYYQTNYGGEAYEKGRSERNRGSLSEELLKGRFKRHPKIKVVL